MSKTSAKLPDFAIDAEKLDKVYNAQGKGEAKHALKGIDLKIPRGSIFGLLGPNGAGKSTFINILAGMVVKSSGRAKIWDIDITNEQGKLVCSSRLTMAIVEKPQM